MNANDPLTYTESYANMTSTHKQTMGSQNEKGRKDLNITVIFIGIFRPPGMKDSNLQFVPRGRIMYFFLPVL